MTKEECFMDAISSTGMSPPGSISPDKWHRFPGIGKNGKNRAGYAYMFPDGLGGVFGDYASGFREIWQDKKVKEYNSIQLADFKALIKNAQKKAGEEQKKEHAKAAKKAEEECVRAPFASGDHPYLKRKGIKLHAGNLKAKEDKLLIPLYNSDGKVTTYQTIDPDGKKMLMPGGKKKGSAFIIPGDKERIFVTEGYSTGASVHEATGNTVIVAVDAGNLLPVVEKLVDKGYKKIIIAADNDHGKPINVGVDTARKVCELFPSVKYQTPPALPGTQSTDWNDYAQSKGLIAVTELFAPQKYKSITLAEIVKTKFRPIRWAVPGIIPEGLTLLAGRPKFGKSWLMLQMCYDIATGGKVWGMVEAEQRSVHYLALEDSFERLQDRYFMQEGYIDLENPPENVHIHIDFPKIGDEFFEELDRIKREDPDVGMIAIDTLQKIRPTSTAASSKRNMYAAEYEDYERLQRWAIRNGVPVVCVHHTRKGGGSDGNPFDEISGSTGIQGVVDTMIVCRDNMVDGQVKDTYMHVTGRSVLQESYKMTLSKRTMSWHVEAKEEDLDCGPLLLRDYFSNHDNITREEAADLFDMIIKTAGRKLEKMVDEGTLVREKIESGKAGKPAYTYHPKERFTQPNQVVEEPREEEEEDDNPWG